MFGKRRHSLPCVLSPAEVVRLFEAASPGRDRVLLQTAYACGLRLGELLHLQVKDSKFGCFLKRIGLWPG